MPAAINVVNIRALHWWQHRRAESNISCPSRGDPRSVLKNGLKPTGRLQHWSTPFWKLKNHDVCTSGSMGIIKYHTNQLCRSYVDLDAVSEPFVEDICEPVRCIKLAAPPFVLPSTKRCQPRQANIRNLWNVLKYRGFHCLLGCGIVVFHPENNQQIIDRLLMTMLA